jgi:hypothetical protein
MYLTADGTIHTAKFEGRSDTPEAAANMVIPEEHEAHIVWLVGHVRYFTHGTPKNMNNNHPIAHGKIVGVHNGVLRNHRQILAVTGREHDDAEVDSEAIFAAVNKWGHRAGLKRVTGDMVTVYANREKPETLHIARTHGRPLVFTHTAGGSLLFASEADIADAATGLPASKYSSLSSYRLVRAKAGRIVERVSLPQPVQEWRKFEGGPDYPGVPDRDDNTANTYRPLPARRYTPSGKLSAALRKANEAAATNGTGDPAAAILDGSEPVSRPTKPARGYARSSSYKDGDVVGVDKVYYKGLLLSTAEYIAEVGIVDPGTEEGVEF